ncbi:MAG: DNA alkylation repair protein [Chloroflexi bacterium]|nr:DNA alkylation repair protein [Chloroflexota bacterium]
MTIEQIISWLESMANPESVKGMARFGISGAPAYGVSLPELRQLDKEIGKDHALAQHLWSAGSRETRILASMVADPVAMTEALMEEWVKDFTDREVCDQTCSNLFERTPFAYAKAVEWSKRDEEFVKRAGFVLMARLAVGKKGATEEALNDLLPHVINEAGDNRPMVWKAVNWALRQIGKRSLMLNTEAIEMAVLIQALDTPSARWIASDALRELKNSAVQERLKAKR